ncbi:MAG: T9SS type A sorting domain-containing protein [Bacteroidales bacterium]|nr:T9SS type A sorting domain-containing protein [Bacteroidales bacterium]MDD4214231.1 T9SS type A sorting domain-containing protein [Bacteroidales bacterium]
MKKITLLIFALCWIRGSYAQYLVIDNSSSGGYEIPFQDTVLHCYAQYPNASYVNYYLDLDGDSINDIRFYLYDWFNVHLWSTSIISVSTFNNFYVHIDTSYIEYYQTFISGLVVDTFRKTTIIKKYNWGDTIHYSNENLLSHGAPLSTRYYHYGPPGMLSQNIDAFWGDTSYIVFTKSQGKDFILYYLKIEVGSEYDNTLSLISAKTNIVPDEIPQTTIELPEDYIFPNPTKEVFYFKEGCDLIEIYSLQGTLVVKENLSITRNFFNVSQLRKGFYFVYLRKNETKFLTKLIKL